MKLVISLLAVVLLCAAFVTAAGGSKGTTGTKVISGYTWCILTIPGGDEEYCQSVLGAYVNDKVVSKTNAEWDRGKLEGWSNPPYAAWQDNSWKGNVNGGSGYTWNFRISWVGPCTNGAVMPDGGKCIWGKFEVLILPRSDTPGPEWFP